MKMKWRKGRKLSFPFNVNRIISINSGLVGDFSKLKWLWRNNFKA